jgi:hypothetical protein
MVLPEPSQPELPVNELEPYQQLTGDESLQLMRQGIQSIQRTVSATRQMVRETHQAIASADKALAQQTSNRG